MNAIPPTPPRLHRYLLAGLVLGFAAGCIEASALLLLEQEPGIRLAASRRALGIVASAGVFDALLGLFTGLGLWIVWRGAIALLAPARGFARTTERFRRRALRVLLVCVPAVAVVLVAAALGRLPRDRAPAARTADPGSPNLVLILVDTLRADVLGAYGGEARTPNLDRLAAEGTLFERVVAPTSWTLPSIVTLFTSSYPRTHGYVDFDRSLRRDIVTLPGRLQEAGYRTQAVVGNPLMGPERGFDRGFDLYDVYGYEVEGKLLLSSVLNKVLRRLGRWPFQSRKPVLAFDPSGPPFLTLKMTKFVRDETINRRVEELVDLSASPLFLYLHYSAPHTPYFEHPLGFLNTAPPLQEPHLDELRRRYRGEVEYVDRVIGEVLGRLEEAGVLDDAYVVVTADHGEEFLDHDNWEHGHSLYEEVIRVPLIVKGPGVLAGQRVPQPARLMDLAPTLLDLARLEVPPEFTGKSLAPLARGGEAPEATAFTYGELTSVFLNPKDRFFSITGSRYKLVRRRTAAGELVAEEVYDLLEDPHETTPLQERPDELHVLAARLDEFEEQAVHAEGEAPSTTELEAISALGYADGGPDGGDDGDDDQP